MTDKPPAQTQPESDEAAFFPNLQREMNRLFDQFRSGLPLAHELTPAVLGASAFPAIDVVDTDDDLEVSAEVPGVDEKDLDVSISGELLILKGKKSSDHEVSEDNYHRLERKYGSFRRHIPLGFTPQDDAVSASFSDGILKLRIKKPPVKKVDVKKVEIQKT